MTKHYDGDFSKTFLSLQLQVTTLLEEVGGDSAAKLLDELSSLTRSEKEILLKAFIGVTEKVSAGQIRLSTPDDMARKEFEDGLYKDVVNAIRQASNPETGKGALRVVDGGLKAKRFSFLQKRSHLKLEKSLN